MKLKKKIPLILLNARITRKTFKRWIKVKEFAQSIFNNILISYPQNQETKLYLKKIIEDLPDKQREVLIMRHYMEMSFQEISEATGVSINTALGRMRYALIALRKKIKPKQVAYE